MQKLLLFFIYVTFSILGSAQVTTDVIKIRKTNPQLIGKTLSLFDLRTRECGQISFTNDTSCTVFFSFKKEELATLRIFLNTKENIKTITCNYELLTDTSFLLTSGDFQDTCTYKYLDDANNLVKMLHTPQGVFEDKTYTFFYGFDSIIYSQSYLRSLKDFEFTDSILLIDSIYKKILDPTEKEILDKALALKITEYKKDISFNYFVGAYQNQDRQLNLLNKNKQVFGHLFLQQNGDFYSVFSHSTFEGKIPVVSDYTHKTYAQANLMYDQISIGYRNPNQVIAGSANEKFDKFIDTFYTHFPLSNHLRFYADADTFEVKNSLYLDVIKIKNKLGGFYPCFYQSLNGKKLEQDNLYFTLNNAYSTTNENLEDTITIWKYEQQGGVLYMYNQKDTLVDEMKNGFESFRFTYKNGQPFVFGAFHYSNKLEKNHEFIVLFENNKGVKITCQNNEYKYAREAVDKGQILEKEGVTYSYFIYSATDEYVWAEFDDGNYEEFSFFNFNKALKIKKGKESKSYYLVN